MFSAPDEHELVESDLMHVVPIQNRSWVVWTAWNLKFDEVRLAQRTALLEAFRPVDSVVQTVAQIFSAMPEGKRLVGLHVRRGDYSCWLEGRYYFSHELYRQLLLRISDLMPSSRLHFVIASDEPIPQEMVTNLSFTCLTGSEIEDLYSLARCEFVLGPPSTFADWATFYGGGRRFVFDGVLPQTLPPSLLI